LMPGLRASFIFHPSIQTITWIVAHRVNGLRGGRDWSNDHAAGIPSNAGVYHAGIEPVFPALIQGSLGERRAAKHGAR
jgi:hypothetical protein